MPAPGKPDAKEAEALASALNRSAERGQTLWIGFLVFALYLATATSTTTHRMLFPESPIKLPVLNIGHALDFYMTRLSTRSGSAAMAEYLDFNGDGILDTISYVSRLTGYSILGPVTATDIQINLLDVSGNLLSAGLITANLFSGIGRSWKLMDAADYNRDGMTELVYEINDIALVYYRTYYMSGTEALSTRSTNFQPAPLALRDTIFLQNVDGQTATWTIDPTTAQAKIEAGQFIEPNPGPTWRMVDQGDFNADGRPDLLWQHDSGTFGIWELDGSALLAADVLPNAGVDWHAVAAADFNGDYKSDILLQQSSGQLAVWYMDGVQLLAGNLLGPNPGLAWHAIDTGDFDGDGQTDILWQHSSGQGAIWELDKGNFELGATIGDNPGVRWVVKGSGDFSGDGKSDILWQGDNGQVGIWDLDGTRILSADNVATPVPGWHVQRTGNFSADFKSDILLQHTDGSVAVWLMDDKTIVDGSNIIARPGADWHII